MILDIKNEMLAEIIPPDGFFEPISTGHQLTEGIVWNHKGNYLIFSDMVQGKIFRWDINGETSVIKTPSNISNGNCIDAEGRIISCEHSTSRVTRIEHDGRYMSVLASHYQGKELNSPNDIIVDSQNRTWFTDPLYGRKSPKVGVDRKPELDFRGVYRIDPDGSLNLVASDFEQPNGLCMELGEKTLLVNDSPRKHIRRFNVGEDGSLTGGEVIAEISGEGLGSPDGMKIDEEGRIYCTGPGGVHVLEPSGKLMGVIKTPEQCRNFCFGDSDMSYLYLATTKTIYRLKTNTHGVKIFK